MTTCDNNSASTRKRSIGALLAAMFWALESCAGFMPTAWAQRNGAEPEVDPQFQQDVQGTARSSGGQPIDNNTQPSSSPAPTADQQPGFVPSVQIGSAAEKRIAQAVPQSPLDVKVSIRVRDASLATFLEIISNQAKVSFIVMENVRNKTVTAFLQNVTVREALQILLEIKGLTYQQVGKSNTYIIRERTKDIPLKITRIYTLNFAPLVPVFNSQNSQSLGQLSSLGGSSGGGGGGGGGAGSAGSTGGGAGGGAGSNQASADSGIAIYQNIKSILSKDGQIGIDPRTNSLIVTDIPEVFPQVEQIIAELDKKAPQVMIEAQIVEIDSDKTRNLGLEWGGADGTLATFSGPQRDTAFPLDIPNNLSKTQFFGPLTNVVSSLGSAASSGNSNNTQAQTAGNTTVINNPILTGSNLKTGIVDLSQLTVVLRALVSHAEARFLGKPKVLTLNNKTATIEVTQDQAVSNVTSITGAQGIANTTSQVERHLTGVRLLVTPQVNKEGYITMLVQPQFSSVVQSALSSGTNPVFDPLTRSENTLVRVKNGQTLVLGGLLSSTENKTIRKVPFFGYIPLIGWLFTSSQYQRQNSDLVIFLTPTIVND